jgi:hypothetical protein
MITPVAMAAFRRLVALESECAGPPACEPYRRCAACEEWWVQQKIIHDELGCKPWEMAIERENTGEWPADEGARRRWKLFEAAASEPEPRGRRKRVRRARTESENPAVVDSDLPSEPVA